MMRLQHQMIALMAVPLLAVGGFITGMVSLERSSEDASLRARQSLALLTATQALSEGVVDAQNGMRGYLASGDPAFAAPYDRALHTVPGLAAALDGLAVHDARQRPIVHGLAFGTWSTRTVAATTRRRSASCGPVRANVRWRRSERASRRFWSPRARVTRER
jgi:CHASE3 domain sensor protein